MLGATWKKPNNLKACSESISLNSDLYISIWQLSPCEILFPPRGFGGWSWGRNSGYSTVNVFVQGINNFNQRAFKEGETTANSGHDFFQSQF